METDFSLFVGDLSPDVDDALLETTFRTYYTSTKHAKVMLDPITQRSRGYGFVRFAMEAERDRALTEMNGVYISTRPVRVSLATARKPQGSAAAAPTSALNASSAPGDAEGGNTTLFIGGLAASVSETDLHTTFSRFGDLVYTKIPAGKGCGFVQFVHRSAAEYAMAEMSGAMLGGQAIRISWGRSQGKPPPPHATTSHHAAAAAAAAAQYHSSFYGSYDPYGAYGSYGAMGYDPYGYSAAAYSGVDPAYASAYAGYAGMAPSAAGYGTAGAASAAGAGAGGHASGASQNGAVQPVLYDPLAPVNTDKQNMGFMHRQMPVLTGAAMRLPVPLAAGGPPV